MRTSSQTLLIILSCLCVFAAEFHSQGLCEEPINISGVYPHLTMRNSDGECGTGAVVPWQGSLWAVTYAPHKPNGSSDKLYEVTQDLEQKIFDGSVGGTPANRMIHRESNQLLIGPYVIDAKKQIRTIPPSTMFGRLTGNARHLSDPSNKVYYATMEEGLYEVDMRSLDVHCIIQDGNPGAPNTGIVSSLPGYHGKGLYSSQGRLVYANNGDRDERVKVDPTVASGALAEWNGSGDWKLVRRNQFTEVTGPAGIYGNDESNRDAPIWSLGWDAKSLILALLENQKWHYFRLPKGSHSYDGAHGWNTEWPRIREIGEENLLATMHGTFWQFPSQFSIKSSSGIKPRSNYLKVIGDFCRWDKHLVLGCDDSAQSEFLNTRSFKATEAAPKQSNSNLWFIAPERIDELGPAIGRGSLWLQEDLTAEQVSDPYMFSGYDYRQVHLTHDSQHPVTFVVEVDRKGTNEWTVLREILVAPKNAASYIFQESESGTWVRLVSKQSARNVTANFQFRNRDRRDATNDRLFDCVAKAVSIKTANSKPSEASYGLMRSLAYNKLGIAASMDATGKNTSYYELNQKMEIVAVDAPAAAKDLIEKTTQPAKQIVVDDASVLIVEDGKRYRLPKSEGKNVESNSDSDFGRARLCREVATERDLLNVQGTFYELPARNAQGIAKIRPIATHNLAIHDFCSHNGLLLFTGILEDSKNPRVYRSDDKKAAVWAGVVDELWKMGKPRGVGGPWSKTNVKAGIPSDPYLMTAYDRKKVTLSSSTSSSIKLEVDIDGTGIWIPYRSFELKANEEVQHEFPEGYSAYWIRSVSNSDIVATVQFLYE